MFLYGMKINLGADQALRDLRKGQEKGYKIPQGQSGENIRSDTFS